MAGTTTDGQATVTTPTFELPRTDVLSVSLKHQPGVGDPR